MKPPVEESVLKKPATAPAVAKQPGSVLREKPPQETPGPTMSVPDELRPGKLFAWFKLQSEIDTSCTGAVWLAQDYSVRRQAEQSALKFIPDSILQDKTAVEQLKNELRRRIELRHPNILRVYDLVEHKGRVAIQMEYLNGQSLSRLRLTRPNHIFEARDLVKWVKELCEALEYARNIGLVDADIVPGNLIVDPAGNLKLKDFGIANSIADSMSRVLAIQDSSEALQYKSPQLAAGGAPVITDELYSLGATIYELLTGKPPFYAGGMGVPASWKIPPSMTERRAELGIGGETIPKSWEETVAACLARDPTQRPQSAVEVVNRLINATSASDIPVASTKSAPDSIPGPKLPIRTLPIREPRRMIAGLSLIFAFGSAIGLFSFRHHGVGREVYEPERPIVAGAPGDQESFDFMHSVPLNETARDSAVPGYALVSLSIAAFTPEMSPTPSPEVIGKASPPETITSNESQIADSSPTSIRETDIDPNKEDVVKRIKALPGVTGERKANLIEKMHKARSMERLSVIPFEIGQTALRRRAADELVKAFEKPGMRDKLSDPTMILVVAGYADIAGRADLNLHFSQVRAENVSKILKEQAKLFNAMQTIGMGGTELLDSKRPEQNRAVEIWAVVPL